MTAKQIYLQASTSLGDIFKQVVEPIAEALKSAKYGVDVSVKLHTNRRTSLQNAYLFANYEEIVRILKEAGCTYGCYHIPYTVELIHDITKWEQGIEHTKNMSTKEFSDFVEKMFAFWIEETAGQFQPLETLSSYMERTGLLQVA